MGGIGRYCVLCNDPLPNELGEFNELCEGCLKDAKEHVSVIFYYIALKVDEIKHVLNERITEVLKQLEEVKK